MKKLLVLLVLSVFVAGCNFAEIKEKAKELIAKIKPSDIEKVQEVVDQI